MLKPKLCEDLKTTRPLMPDSYECEECVKTGDSWVHLRKCQECGITLCCDSSPNQHATKHFNSTNHPVAASAEPGETWAYCYKHKLATNNFLK